MSADSTAKQDGRSPSDHPLPEKDNGDLPYTHFSARQRAFIVFIAASTALVSPLSSNMYYPSIQEVRDDLHTTLSGVTWSITSFAICMAIAPLFWSNLADQIGRKPVYATSMLIYTAGSIGCALSKSLTAMIISRVIQAAGSSAVQGSGAGTISDIYPREQRGTALGIYYLGPLVGPCIGPLIGGYIGQDIGWRWVFWILAIWGGVMCLLATLVQPETHRRIVLKKHRIQPTNIPPPLNLKNNNPLIDLALIRYPSVAITMYFFAMVFGAYMVNSTGLTLALQNIYNLSQGSSGVCYLPVGAGNIIGSTTGGRTTDLLLRRYRKKHDMEVAQGSKVPPEARIRLVWLGGIICLVGMAMSGWIIDRSWPLAALLVMQFFIGVGLAFAFQSIAGYLIDLFPLKSARITGVQNFYRGIWGAIIVQLFPTMIESIGWGWSYTTMVLVSVPGLVGLQLLALYGEGLRRRFGPKM